MDPVTTAIVAAITAGATKAAGQVAERAIADAYAGLKNLLRSRFGERSEVVAAVEAVEARPDSEGRRTTLSEEIAAAKAADDPDVRRAAERLLEQITARPDGEQHVQNAVGNYIAQADRGGHASVNVNRSDPPAPPTA